MLDSLKLKKQRLTALADLSEGSAVKFEFVRDGITYEGFVFLWRGKVVAYENVCRHLPLSLDYGDSRFFTTDGRHIVCQTHGALYEPESGLCLRGPCEGASLKPLTIEVGDDSVWLLLNEAE